MRRSLIISGVLLALLVLGGSLGLMRARAALNAPLGSAAAGYVLNIPAGQAFGQLVAELARDGILSEPRLTRWYARWQGLDQRVQAGEYLLDEGLTIRSLLDRLVAGEVMLHSLTVVEGSTVRDLLTALRTHPAVSQTLADDALAEVTTLIQLPDAYPEGWFFPDTYRFPRGTTDRELLRQAHELMRSKLDAAWAGRAEELPLRSPYEALILASVILRETDLASERPEIAGVFVRRLQKGMRLQTDPTVIYGIGPDFNGNLTRRDLATDTPYNTYTRAGLPPTPIALPGEGALRAAVNPAPGDALYFVATGLPDGSHTFSLTLEEHNRAVAQYLRRLRSRQGGS
jgi:UPF0755 protein